MSTQNDDRQPAMAAGKGQRSLVLRTAIYRQVGAIIAHRRSSLECSSDCRPTGKAIDMPDRSYHQPGAIIVSRQRSSTCCFRLTCRQRSSTQCFQLFARHFPADPISARIANKSLTSAIYHAYYMSRSSKHIRSRIFRKGPGDRSAKCRGLTCRASILLTGY